MIIKDDKVVEPIEEQAAEIPPPYSPPQVRVVGVNQNVSSPVQSRSQASRNNNRNQISNFTFRPRGGSSASIAPSSVSGGVPASSSSSYSGSVTSGTTSSSATLRPADPYPSIPPPPDIRSTSYVRINRRNRPVSARLVINPYLPLPHHTPANSAMEDEEGDNGSTDGDNDYGLQFGSILPGDPGERNVCLQAMNANINAEVWVTGKSPENADPFSDYGSAKKKAGIDIRSKNGFVRIKLHASASSPSFALRMACKNGSIRVVLPRTFSGPLTTRTRNGWVTLSTELANYTTLFSETCGIRKAFVGEFVDSGYGRGEWPGCSADITCENGRIKLCYHDEDTDKSLSISSGDKKFFGRAIN